VPAKHLPTMTIPPRRRGCLFFLVHFGFVEHFVIMENLIPLSGIGVGLVVWGIRPVISALAVLLIDKCASPKTKEIVIPRLLQEKQPLIFWFGKGKSDE
jgi:hypothetical protein